MIIKINKIIRNVYVRIHLNFFCYMTFLILLFKISQCVCDCFKGSQSSNLFNDKIKYIYI